MKPAVRSLYAHIPFCPSKCSYCAFVTHVGSLKLAPAYVDALCLDAERTAAERPRAELNTIYFGGGTPSLLTPEQIDRLLVALASLFGIAPGAEITLEAHPSTVDRAKLEGFRSAGINRISFGGESLIPGELLAIGRQHTPGDVLTVVREARSAGYSSVALDLIYGLPGQTPDSWQATLRTALHEGIDHLSLYPLSIEPRTVFARQSREGSLHLPEDEAVVELYSLACRELHRAGFVHYEVSNWARPGHESRHNLGYWRNQEYFAIGTGAHGYLKPYRTERVRQTRRYIEMVTLGIDPVVRREEIGVETEQAERVMLGLRLLDEGLDLGELARTGTDLQRTHRTAIDRLTALGLVRVEGYRLLLAETAVPVANEVWQSFM